MEKQKAIEIPASERYDSPYSGEQETAILQYAEKLKDQTAASDGDTVQVYDVDGNPHKVAKSELLKKSTLALPDLSDISKFVAVNAKGDAIGLMTKEQVAQVLGELIGVATPSKDGLMSRDGFIKHESSSVSKDANTWFTGYVRADGFQNIPEAYGALLSFSTGSTVLQFFWTSEKIYWRNNWDGWHAWKIL